jgi:hypothetical protein
VEIVGDVDGARSADDVERVVVGVDVGVGVPAGTDAGELCSVCGGVLGFDQLVAERELGTEPRRLDLPPIDVVEPDRVLHSCLLWRGGRRRGVGAVDVQGVAERSW